MLTADALRLWSWHFISFASSYQDTVARDAALAQKEQLEHYKIKESTYKIFLQAIVFAGADDPNLEFSLATTTLISMTGLCKAKVNHVIKAAVAMGHITYTGRHTKQGNPSRRTRIYRITALDQPDFLYGFEPQLELRLRE